MKVAENSPQNARNCTIFKNFLGGACPQTPLAKARSFAARDMPLCGMYIQNPRNFKVGPPSGGEGEGGRGKERVLEIFVYLAYVHVLFLIRP